MNCSLTIWYKFQLHLHDFGEGLLLRLIMQNDRLVRILNYLAGA